MASIGNHSSTHSLSSALRGVLLPVTTPFSKDGVVDLSAFKSNLDKWSQTGITGYVFLGSTGERVHLDDSEYVRIVEFARGCVSNDHALIAGAGQQSTISTIKEIERAAAAGKLRDRLDRATSIRSPTGTTPSSGTLK